MSFELRQYQTDAGVAIEKHLIDLRLNRLLVKKPTGTGKTVWFAALLEQFPRLKAWIARARPAGARGARMLVIAHREELLDQAAEKILRMNPTLLVTIEQGDRKATQYADVIIASIQTLAARKFARLRRLIERHPNLSIVIVDEAHHAAAASYRTTLAHLGFLPMAPGGRPGDEEAEAEDFDDVAVMERRLKDWDATARKDRILIGVTATPNRSDAVGLGCVFQTIAYSYALKDAIADGWLVPIEPWVVETDVSLDAVRTTAGEFNQKDLAEAVNVARRNELALAAWLERAKGLQTIGFTVDVAHAHAMAGLFRGVGIAAVALSGETPKDERRRILRDFTARRVTVIFNCMVLTEGTDLPLTECILHLKPTKSATLYEQMTGRGLRIHPGKGRCVVIDVVDIARKHSLLTSPILQGLPPGLVVNGANLQTVERDLEALREKYPGLDVAAVAAELGGHCTLEQLRARARRFDVWTVPDLGPVGSIVTLNWMKFGEAYRLQYPWSDGKETLDVGRDMLDHWELVTTLRIPPKADGDVEEVRQRTIATSVPSVEAALLMAEAFIERDRRTVWNMKNRSAAWRHNPASQKQLQALDRFHVPYDARKVTSGEASDLLDLAFEEMRARRGDTAGGVRS